MKVGGRGFDADGHAFHLHIHGGPAGQLNGVLMGYDGIDGRIFRGSFVEIHGDGYVVLLDELRNTIGHPLSEGAAVAAGISPVQIAGLTAGKGLTAGAVHIYIRIRPLVDGIGSPGAKAEGPLPAGGLNGIKHGSRFLGIRAGKSTVVGPGDDIHDAGFWGAGFNEGNGCHHAGRFVWMGASQHQNGGAGNAGIQHIDLRVAIGSLKLRIVVGKHLLFRYAGAGVNGLVLPHGGEQQSQVHNGAYGQQAQKGGGEDAGRDLFFHDEHLT